MAWSVYAPVSDPDVYESVRWDLMRYATALVGNADAGDVVSTVANRTLARRGGLTALDNPKHYLMRAVLNEVRSGHRRRVRQRVVVEKPGREVALSLPVDESDDVEWIVSAIDELPARQRAAAFLVFHEGYSPSEAADLMGCRPATVRRYLHLARAKLQVVLGE